MDKQSLQHEHARLNYALATGYRRLRALELEDMASDIGYYNQRFEDVDADERTRFVMECLPLNLRNLDEYKKQCDYLGTQLSLSAERGWIKKQQLN
jgi:hypothetical protein